MNELAQALTADSAHAAPSHILEELSDELAKRTVRGAPHTIYEELWHLASGILAANHIGLDLWN